ncbi:hypothetical protein [Pseudomaricurvus sp. HS19]|uniref:hypothetical protein n=1 Tax=Pseudomaricurvus sp. HS19 TaxID=2692626 RepID=UPI001370A524|nr:hypothetical protein [Pseudomaricurvus sp. HS19]MYM62021.1 hypothetical protein [Pseudomaricurvus sp. HS19]
MKHTTFCKKNRLKPEGSPAELDAPGISATTVKIADSCRWISYIANKDKQTAFLYFKNILTEKNAVNQQRGTQNASAMPMNFENSVFLFV